MEDRLSLSADLSSKFRILVDDRLNTFGWSHNDLASRTGFSRSEITKRLSGSKPIRIDYALVIAKVLNIEDFPFMIQAGSHNIKITEVSNNDSQHLFDDFICDGPFSVFCSSQTPLHENSYIWDPTQDTVSEYLETVYPLFEPNGRELIYSDFPVTRLVWPQVQMLCGRTTDTQVKYKFVQICISMNKFWMPIRMSRKKKAKIINIVPLDRFVSLVKTPLLDVPSAIRDEWPIYRLKWLHDLRHQIHDEERCDLLFIKDATLNKYVDKNIDIKEIYGAFSTCAVINEAHSIRRLRSTSELIVTSHPEIVQALLEGLKRLERLALKQAERDPDVSTLKVIDELIKWS